MPTVAKDLLELFSRLDEGVVVASLDATPKDRQDAIIDALKAHGVNVPLSSEEKWWYQSKKFWAGTFAMVILVLGEIIEKDLFNVALPAMVYIFGQGLADLGKNRLR